MNMQIPNIDPLHETVLELSHPQIGRLRKSLPLLSGCNCKLTLELHDDLKIPKLLAASLYTSQSVVHGTYNWPNSPEPHTTQIRLKAQKPWGIKVTTDLHDTNKESLYNLKKCLQKFSPEQKLLSLIQLKPNGSRTELMSITCRELLTSIKRKYSDFKNDPQFKLIDSIFAGATRITESGTDNTIALETLPYNQIQMSLTYEIANDKCEDEIAHHIENWIARNNYLRRSLRISTSSKTVKLQVRCNAGAEIKQLALTPGVPTSVAQLTYKKCWWRWGRSKDSWVPEDGTACQIGSSIDTTIALGLDQVKGSSPSIKGLASVRFSLVENQSFMQVLEKALNQKTELQWLTYDILAPSGQNGRHFSNEIVFKYNAPTKLITQFPRKEMVIDFPIDYPGIEPLNIRIHFHPNFNWSLAVDFGTSGISAAVYLQKGSKAPLKINSSNLAQYRKQKDLSDGEFLESSPFITPSVVNYEFVDGATAPEITPVVIRSAIEREKVMLIENFKMLMLLKHVNLIKIYTIPDKDNPGKTMTVPMAEPVSTSDILSLIFDKFLNGYQLTELDTHIGMKPIDLSEIEVLGPWFNQITLTMPNSFSPNIIGPIYREIRKKIRGKLLAVQENNAAEKDIEDTSFPCQFNYLSESDATLSYYLKSGGIRFQPGESFYAIVLDIGAGTTDLSLAHVTINKNSEDVQFLGHIGYPAGGNFYDFIIAEALVKYCAENGHKTIAGSPRLYVSGSHDNTSSYNEKDHYKLRNFIRNELKPQWGSDEVKLPEDPIIEGEQFQLSEQFFTDLLAARIDTACGKGCSLGEIVNMTTIRYIEYMIKASTLLHHDSQGQTTAYKLFLGGRGAKWKPVREALNAYVEDLTDRGNKTSIQIITPEDLEESQHDHNAKTMVAMGATYSKMQHDASESFATETMLSYFAVLTGIKGKILACKPLYDFWDRTQTSLGSAIFSEVEDNVAEAEEVQVFSVYLNRQYSSENEKELLASVKIIGGTIGTNGAKNIRIYPANEENLSYPEWRCSMELHGTAHDANGLPQDIPIFPPDLEQASLAGSDIIEQSMWPFLSSSATE
jgi:hypothetical protein